jgi:hypothetical protein
MAKFIVMTASEKMPSSCKGNYGRIAVVETDGVTMPKQINPKHKAVKKILATWERLHIGKTENSAFQVALKKAQRYCDKLNLLDSILEIIKKP